MANVADQIAQFIQATEDLRTTRYISLASATALLFDTILTIPDEVEYIWGTPWSHGKILFYLNRYPALLYNVVQQVDMLDFNLSPLFCVVMTHLTTWTTLLFLMPVQVIFILRINALWENNRRILWLLTFTAIAADITIVVAISLINTHIKWDLPFAPLKEVFGCFAGLQSLSDAKVAVVAWTALMCFDTMIFLMTLIRAVRNYHLRRTRLIHVFFRDGFIYYTIILALSVANTISFATVPANRSSSVAKLPTLINPSMTIVANRILINLRGAMAEQMYCGSRTIQTVKLDTIQFAAAPPATSKVQDIEMCSTISSAESEEEY